MVEYVQENYKEKKVAFSYFPLVYHSIQVNTSSGPKVIILKGDNYNYRSWLRQYMAVNKNFIVRLADDLNDIFISSKAFEIDITAIHPIARTKWVNPDILTIPAKILPEDDYVLIIDPDHKRGKLIQNIIEKMGLNTLVYKSEKQALNPLRLQPEKFRMIITNHLIIESRKKGSLIHELVNINQDLPIIVDPGYRNEQLKQKYTVEYKKYPSVIIKPVILQNLSKLIEQLMPELV